MQMSLSILLTASVILMMAGQANARSLKSSSKSKSGKTSTKSGKGAKAGINGCSIEDTLYFSSSYAEFADVASNAAEALAISIETGRRADPPNEDGVIAYLTGDRTDPEAVFVEFMEGIASPNFSATVTSYRRTDDFQAPVVQLPYPTLDSFISGFELAPGDPASYLPGFYAILPFRGLFLNPNGGSSGYTKCDDGEATSTIRTIDVFVAVGGMTDNDPADGQLDNESALGRIVIGWEYSQGKWLLNSLAITVNQLGYTSFGSYN